MRRSLAFAALAITGVSPASADDAPRERLFAAFERDADYAVDGFAFTAEMTLRIRGRGRDVRGQGRADYDPRAPEGERWTVHLADAANVDGSDFKDEEERQDAIDTIRNGFGDGLVRAGFFFRDRADRIEAVEAAGPDTVTLKFAAPEDAGKGARRSAQNTLWTAKTRDGCVTRFDATLLKSFKPAIVARVNRADNRFAFHCPADGPAHLTRFTSETEGEALGGSFLSALEVTYTDVSYVGPPAGRKTASGDAARAEAD